MIKSALSNFQFLSVMDRLIDTHPDKINDKPLRGQELIEKLIDDIRRSVTALLNSRKRYLSWPLKYKELNLSVLDYGMEDFTNYLAFSKERQEKLCSDLERVISLYESRLTNIKVTLETQDNLRYGVVQFEGEGDLTISETQRPLFIKITLNTKDNLYKIES